MNNGKYTPLFHLAVLGKRGSRKTARRNLFFLQKKCASKVVEELL
jgi:hypothetical protein